TMSSDTRLLGPPPGDGVKTLSCAVPTDATSKDGTLIRSCVALTYVVVRLTPFHRATDDETKPLPLSVSVIGTPATAGAGVSDVRVGTGYGACATVIDGLVAARMVSLFRNRRNSYVPGVDGIATGHVCDVTPPPT